MSFLNSLSAADISHLAQSYLFKGLSNSEVHLVAQKSKVKKIKQATELVAEGNFTRGLFILLEGEIQVFLPKTSASNQKRVSEVMLARLQPGAAIGEYSLIDDYPASASVKCLKNCRFAFLSQLDFESLVSDQDRCGRIIYKNLLKSMINRLRENNTQLDALFVVN